MSSYNEANEMASELVFGTTYDGEALGRPKPERLVFVKGDSIAVVTATESIHDEWAETASSIERLLREGYRLGCDMNVSWNGRYDLDGDPEPGRDYLPCHKPVAVNVGGRNLCDLHGLATGKVRLVVNEHQKGAEGV